MFWGMRLSGYVGVPLEPTKCLVTNGTTDTTTVVKAMSRTMPHERGALPVAQGVRGENFSSFLTWMSRDGS